MQEPDHRWQKLVKAARKAPPPEPDEQLPPGLVSRIIGLRDAIAAFARTLAWRRWSVLAALLAAGLLAAVFALTRCEEESAPLILPPEPISPGP